MLSDHLQSLTVKDVQNLDKYALILKTIIGDYGSPKWIRRLNQDKLYVVTCLKIIKLSL